jgi:hypothetical protein
VNSFTTLAFQALSLISRVTSNLISVGEAKIIETWEYLISLLQDSSKKTVDLKSFLKILKILMKAIEQKSLSNEIAVHPKFKALKELRTLLEHKIRDLRVL